MYLELGLGGQGVLGQAALCGCHLLLLPLPCIHAPPWWAHLALDHSRTHWSKEQGVPSSGVSQRTITPHSSPGCKEEPGTLSLDLGAPKGAPSPSLPILKIGLGTRAWGRGGHKFRGTELACLEMRLPEIRSYWQTPMDVLEMVKLMKISLSGFHGTMWDRDQIFSAGHWWGRT